MFNGGEEKHIKESLVNLRSYLQNWAQIDIARGSIKKQVKTAVLVVVVVVVSSSSSSSSSSRSSSSSSSSIAVPWTDYNKSEKLGVKRRGCVVTT